MANPKKAPKTYFKGRVDGMEYVYLFYLGHDNAYKIGRSLSWENRMWRLGAANPWMKMVKVVLVDEELARYLEEKLMDEFKDCSIGREMFEFENTDMVIALMEALT